MKSKVDHIKSPRDHRNNYTILTSTAPHNYHRVKTFYTSLDDVLAEIEIRFSGNDQDALCALGDITLSDSPTSDSFESFDLVASYYNLDRELLQADQRMFSQFKSAQLQKLSKC